MKKWFTLAEIAGADMEDYPITHVQIGEDSVRLSCELKYDEPAHVTIEWEEDTIWIFPNKIGHRYEERLNDWTSRLKDWLENHPKFRLHAVTKSDFVQIGTPYASSYMLPSFLRLDR